jgi:nucleoside-diphosphate-sugar epimerase
MKLAITGGAGFLGYHIAERLRDRFDELRIIDIVGIDAAEYPPNAAFAPSSRPTCATAPPWPARWKV